MEEIESIQVQQVYEVIAKHFSNTRKLRWDWVDKFLYNIPNNNLVYDIGCGNGRNMELKHLNFIGIDNCYNFLQICREKNLNVIYSNITKLPFKNNSADALICIAVFHHLASPKQRIKALLEMNRVLKNNGTILISVWSINQPPKTKKNFKYYGDNIVLWNSYGSIYERYYYIFALKEINQLFIDAGFNVISYEYNCGNEIFKLQKISFIL